MAWTNHRRTEGAAGRGFAGRRRARAARAARPGPAGRACAGRQARRRCAMRSPDFAPDVILSDFSMPGFSGQEALEIARDWRPDVPFIFVSGTIGEELAIHALQRGAIDYVLKDNLRRLPSAVERALGIAPSSARAPAHASARCARARSASARSSRTARTGSGKSSRTPHHLQQRRDREHPRLPARRTARHPRRRAHAADEDREDGACGGCRRWSPQRRAGTLAAALAPSRRQRAGAGEHRHAALDEDGEVHRLPRRRPGRHRAPAAGEKIRQLARIHAVLSALGNVVLRAANRDELLRRRLPGRGRAGRFHAAAALVCASPMTALAAGGAGYGDPAVLDVGRARTMPIPMPRRPLIAAPDSAPSARARTGTRSAISPAPICPERRPQRHGDVGIRPAIALPIGTGPWGLLALFSGSGHRSSTKRKSLCSNA